MSNREVAQAGSALGLGPRGRRFESCLPDTFKSERNKAMSDVAFAFLFYFYGRCKRPTVRYSLKTSTSGSSYFQNFISSLIINPVIPSYSAYINYMFKIPTC